MTLGSWFRDYLFYPVMRSKGITRLSKRLKKSGHKAASKSLPTIIALAVVWFSTGLWHGASWNYVLWGVYYGFWLILEKFVLDKAYKKLPGLVSTVIQRASFVFITLFGFAIFYHEKNLFANLGYLFGVGTNGLTNAYTESMIYENGILLIVSFVCCLPLAKMAMEAIRKRVYTELGTDTAYTFDRLFKTIVILVLFALGTVRLVGNSYNPFIYFRF
jgi:alginate O-acetyltransferase complex protein AlgI